MRRWKRAILSAAAAAVVVVAVLLVGIATTSAAGAVSYTQTFHNATDVQSLLIPCTNEPGTVTLTYNGIFHATELTSGQGAGTFWATGTMTGDFVIEPNDATQPSYTGHFATWFGDNNNLHNGTETSILSVHGTGSDGSTLRFHDVAHLSVSASGMTVFFDKPSCG
jgi:hypothetical protein